MKNIRKIFRFCFYSFLCVMALNIKTYAQEMQEGSVSISIPDYNGQELTVNYLKIAEYTDGEFCMKESLEKFGNLNEIETSRQMEDICEKLESEISNYETSIQILEKEKFEIRNLKTGAYFFNIECKEEKFSPFIVMIPFTNEKDAEVQYDFTVYPKHTKISNNPVAPQTGFQSKIRNYLFVGLICAFLSVLCFMRAEKDKKFIDSTKRELKILNGYVTMAEKENNPLLRTINFDILQSMNPDICGWIYIPGTNIDQPVLIGENDETYLKKNYKGEYNEIGSVFAFADTSKDFSDAHICIFAHNMKKPLMFGELKKYRNLTFAKEHKTMYFYTPEQSREYDLFSVYECEKNDQTFRHDMLEDSEEFENLKKYISGCDNTGNVEEAKADQIVTLACCSENDRIRKRMTVHFKKNVEMGRLQ